MHRLRHLGGCSRQTRVFFQTDQGGIGFYALLPPSVSALNKLLRRIILSLLKRLTTEQLLQEATAWMQTLAQSLRTATGPTSDEPPSGLCAFAEGFSLHPGVSVDKSDGEGQERLPATARAPTGRWSAYPSTPRRRRRRARCKKAATSHLPLGQGSAA